jgi:hypothetical protein
MKSEVSCRAGRGLSLRPAGSVSIEPGRDVSDRVSAVRLGETHRHGRLPALREGPLRPPNRPREGAKRRSRWASGGLPGGAVAAARAT